MPRQKVLLHISRLWGAQMQICEVDDRRALSGISTVLHLRWNKHETFTLCRKQVRGGTFVPLDAWGLHDAEWCARCERRSMRPHIPGEPGKRGKDKAPRRRKAAVAQ